MKIKKILVGIIFSAVMLLTACSGGDTQMSEEEKALQQQLIGVWFYPDSAVYDNDGDLTGFSAYQFTDEVIKCHDVGNGQIMSYALNLYTIKDDKIVVNNDGQRQYALISVKEVDGKDHLFWDIDTKTMEFIRMTDEEIEEYVIPVDKMTAGCFLTRMRKTFICLLNPSLQSASATRASVCTRLEAETIRSHLT